MGSFSYGYYSIWIPAMYTMNPVYLENTGFSLLLSDKTPLYEKIHILSEQQHLFI
jgi:hypothetical protein